MSDRSTVVQLKNTVETTINPATEEKQNSISAILDGTSALADTPESFEDTSFVTGDSPVTLDCNTALGRNATRGYISNDGNGDFTVQFSTDGINFGDSFTIKPDDTFCFEKISVDSIKITWIADTAYRVLVI